MPILLLLLWALPGIRAAVDGPAIEGPVVGFVYDVSSRALCPLPGVPGSAYLGPALISGVDMASAAPDASAALAVQGGRLLLSTGMKGQPLNWVSIESAIAGVDRIAWFKTSAALYSSTLMQAQIIDNLTQTPGVSEPIDLSGLAGRVSAIALAGDSLIVAVEDPDSGGIYLVSAAASQGNSPRLVVSARTPAALAIAGNDLFYVDRETGAIWEVPNFASNWTPILFATIDSPVGLGVASGRLLVASAGTKQLRLFDIVSRTESATLDLDFTPTSLEPAGMPSQWLLARGTAGIQPYYLLDISQTPAIYFVPAGLEQQ